MRDRVCGSSSSNPRHCYQWARSLFEFRIMQTQKREDLPQAEKKHVTRLFEKSISDFNDLVTALVHLEKLGCKWDDALKAFAHRSKYGLGFNDAMNLAVMERNDLSDIYTFDKSFNNIPWLRRKDV